MKIEVKLFATLRKLLPPTDEGSPAFLEVAEGTSVAGLLEELRIPKEMAHLVLINGVNIEKDHGRTLQDGDTVCVFPPVAGGVSRTRVSGVGCCVLRGVGNVEGPTLNPSARSGRGID